MFLSFKLIEWKLDLWRRRWRTSETSWAKNIFFRRRRRVTLQIREDEKFAASDEWLASSRRHVVANL